MRKAILGMLVLVILALFMVGCQPAGEATARALQKTVTEQKRIITAQDAEIARLNEQMTLQQAVLDQTSALAPKPGEEIPIGVRDIIEMFSEILNDILRSMNIANIPEPKELPPTTTYIVNCYSLPGADKCFVSTATTNSYAVP